MAHYDQLAAAPAAPEDGFGSYAAPQVAWAKGLCDCCAACEVCVLGYCFPCVLFGQNKRLLTGEDCWGPCCSFCLIQHCACCCLPCFTSTLRTDLRAAQNLPK